MFKATDAIVLSDARRSREFETDILLRASALSMSTSPVLAASTIVHLELPLDINSV
jgi:hypothetical protein